MRVEWRLESPVRGSRLMKPSVVDGARVDTSRWLAGSVMPYRLPHVQHTNPCFDIDYSTRRTVPSKV